MKYAHIKQRLVILLIVAVYLPSVFYSTLADSWLESDGFYGDLDGNAVVNASDALLCLQASVKLIVLGAQQTIAADVDGNGFVDASDALYILQMSVGLISWFPACPSRPSEGSTSPPSSSTVTSQPEPPSSSSTVTSEPEPPSSSSTVTSQPEPPSSSSTVTSEPEPPSSSSTVTPLPENPEISDFGYTAVDPSDYYCFAQLNDTQQNIYLTLHRNAMAMTQGSFEVGSADAVDFSDVWLAYLAYTNDHPEVFWLDRGLRYSTNSSSATVCFGVDGTGYLYTKAQRDAMQSELISAVKQAFAECLLPGLTPSQRELRLHDWLAEHCVYQYPAV